MIFGQLIFRTTKNEPEKSFKCERIKDESEKIENKRLKVSYFYLRLLRKLAGLLEAPYNGNVSKNNTNVAQSMRKCFLSWIRTAMEQFIEEFKAVVNGPNITEQQKKIIGMRNLDKFEVANEHPDMESLPLFFLYCLIQLSHTKMTRILILQ
uniref:Ras-GAP domain-containing protein n=1 Tax=Globodera pallida TaxID=36090 RepID=A0A183CFD9_GLOPA